MALDSEGNMSCGGETPQHSPQVKQKSWNVGVSTTAQNTFNPIRAIVDEMKCEPNPDKPHITLSLGDPTVFGNFEPAPESVEAICDVVRSGKYNGYAPSLGYRESREALAEYLSTKTAHVTPEDIYLSCGCSDALGMAITVLASPGDNILIPRPGFSLYKTLAMSQGISVKPYDCLPTRSWEIDLDHVATLIDERTKAIIVVNPSNPCGSNFNRQHILDILRVAEAHKVPVIADEIYADMVFAGQTFHSCASLSTSVPILSCGGMAKRFLVPGWRLGWVVVHDRMNIFGDKIRLGLLKLTQRVLGPCTLVQAALPAVLRIPGSFHRENIRKLEENADFLFTKLNGIRGLNPVRPAAAMYMMVGFDKEHFPEFKDDVGFTERLIAEESVFCLPAKCFEYPHYFRVVLTIPEPQMEEACVRIRDFCCRHYK